MSLDREIEELLAVDPSPEFVAKVRQRIADEPAPRTWWPDRRSLGEGGFSWPLATAAAVAVAVVAAVALWPVAPTSVSTIPSTSAADATTAGTPTREVALAPTADPALAPTSEAKIAPTAEREFAPAGKANFASTSDATIARSGNVAVALNRTSRPVVLIQREEAEAMNLLLTRVRQGALPDMTEALAAVDAMGPAWIEIPPVTIEPIATGEGE